MITNQNHKIRFYQTLLPWSVVTCLMSSSSHLFPTSILCTTSGAHCKTTTTETEIRNFIILSLALSHRVRGKRKQPTERGNATKHWLTAKGNKFKRAKRDCLSSYFVDIARPLGQVQKGRLACDVVHKDDALENREQLKNEFRSSTWR